jgi:Tfp pilus assembly protein FimT
MQRRYLKIKKYEIGVTLLELIILLAITGILYIIYIPISQLYLQHNHLEIVENDIKGAIRYARNMALIRGENLALIPLTNDWSTGMQLIVDNPLHRYNDKDELIHQWQWYPIKLKITWHGFQSNYFLSFTPNFKQSSLSGHFLIIDLAGKQKKLVVNRIGRVI